MLALDITIQFSDLWAVLATIVFIVVMSSVSSRLLGVRSKRWRSFLASALGWIIGLAAGGTIAKHRSLDEFYTVAALFAVLATMTLMIVIDVVFQPRAPRSGRRRRRNLLHPLRWVRLKLSPVGRFRQVLRYARKRQLARLEFMSAGAIGTKEFGRRLRLTLEDAGGMFVKFGQIASTRTDLLAEPVVEELSQLRAAVRPIPPDELRALIEDELGRPVEEVFTSFTWEPMAAASIGQAHRASLPGGEEVVVKIQRPGLDELLGRDATVLRFAAAMAERRVEAARRLGLRALAEELILGMERELDYGREATMSKRLAAELEFDGAIAIPAVFDEVSTSRLLVMEEARGKSVDDPLAVSLGGVLPDDLARSLLRSFMAQVLGGGAYHADPHPGNVLIDETGKLWLLDFGAVGLLDATSRESLQEMALGMTLNEPLMVARAVRRLAKADSDTDLRLLESDIGMLMVESMGGGFDPRAIQDVLTLMGRYGLTVPPSMTQLSRALLTLDGTLRIIAPLFDLPTEATALVREVANVQQDPGGDALQHELLRALPILRTLPEHADELATQLRAGRMTIRVDRFAGDDQLIVERWVDRVMLAAAGCGGVIAAAILLLAASQTRSTDVGDVLRAVGFIGLVFGFVLLLRTVAQVFQRERPSSR